MGLSYTVLLLLLLLQWVATEICFKLWSGLNMIDWVNTISDGGMGSGFAAAGAIYSGIENIESEASASLLCFFSLIKQANMHDPFHRVHS